MTGPASTSVDMSDTAGAKRTGATRSASTRRAANGFLAGGQMATITDRQFVLGVEADARGAAFKGGTTDWRRHQQERRLTSTGDRPRRMAFDPLAGLRQGRCGVCRATVSSSNLYARHHGVTDTGSAGPSAPASNTHSLRHGRPSSNTTTWTSAPKRSRSPREHPPDIDQQVHAVKFGVNYNSAAASATLSGSNVIGSPLVAA